MGQHSSEVIVIAISWIIFLLTLIFSGLAETGQEGIFFNSTGTVNDEYPTEFTPAYWTYVAWWIIFILQSLWMIYLLTTVFRQTPEGEYIYVKPGPIPWGVHIFFIVANICNVVWLLLYDRHFMVASFLIIGIVALTLFVATVLATRGLVEKYDDMVEQGLMTDIWIIRILVHNSLAFYATWAIIEALLNLTIVLIYQSPINATNENASSSALGILAFVLVFWTALDLALFDKYTRYLLVPYFVVFWAMAGITDTDHDHLSRNRVFAIVLLVASIMALALKVATMIYRALKNPCEEEQPLCVKKSSIDVEE